MQPTRLRCASGVADAARCEPYPPGSLLDCFLPLHNRLQLERDYFLLTNIISVSIFITLCKDLASAMELVTDYKVKITEKDYWGQTIHSNGIRRVESINLFGGLTAYGQFS
jgi:hypothetical protein